MCGAIYRKPLFRLPVLLFTFHFFDSQNFASIQSIYTECRCNCHTDFRFQLKFRRCECTRHFCCFPLFLFVCSADSKTNGKRTAKRNGTKPNSTAHSKQNSATRLNTISTQIPTARLQQQQQSDRWRTGETYIVLPLEMHYNWTEL